MISKKKLERFEKQINFYFKNKENLLGSAYDADSEGVEGKYYVWDDKELKKILEKDYDFFTKYYGIPSMFIARKTINRCRSILIPIIRSTIPYRLCIW